MNPSSSITRSGARASHEHFGPVRSRKTLDDVQHQLADAIRSGKIGEGELLPGERVLAEQMQVSRPTVRAAVQELVNAGVLEVTSGRGGGARVLSIWVPPDLTPASRRTPSSDAVFRLLEARRAVEPRLAQLAALRGTERHFLQMERSIDRYARHSEGYGPRCPLGQQLLDVSEAEREAQIHPDSTLDDVTREAVARIRKWGHADRLRRRAGRSKGAGCDKPFDRIELGRFSVNRRQSQVACWMISAGNWWRA